MTDVFQNDHVTARKMHLCSLCQQPIVKGERHRVWRGKYDGEFETHRYHETCDLVTEIDEWDQIDWESFCDPAEFRYRKQELIDAGKIVMEARP